MSAFASIVDKLDAINDVKGNAKLPLIEQLNEEEKRIINLMLNPYIRFGIRKLPKIDIEGRGMEDEDIHAFLSKLADRTITGGFAATQLHAIFHKSTFAQREAIARCLLKDPKAGFGANTFNKVFKKFIPTFNVALADKYDPENFSGPRLVSPKLDGMRTLARVQLVSDSVEFMSREGNPITTMAHLTPSVLAFAKTLIIKVYGEHFDEFNKPWPIIYLDGETVTGSFNKTVSELRKKDKKAEDASFVIFDFFSEASLKERKQLEPWTQEQRQSYLYQTMHDWDNMLIYNKAKKADFNGGLHHGIRVMKTLILDNEDAVQNAYTTLHNAGYEGLVVKDLNAKYNFRRNKAWSKLKGQIDADGEIIGFEKGDENKGFSHTLGKIVVRLESGIEVRVSSGLSLEMRDYVWKHQDEFEGRVVEVLGHEYTPDGSIRHPRFFDFPNCLRDTKEFIGSKF